MQLLRSERSQPNLAVAHAPDEDGTAGVAGAEDGGHDLKSERFAGDPVLEACFDGLRLLKLGDSGEAVSKIQLALMDAGFPLPQFGPDGRFGGETKTALEGFQRESGLSGRKVDGVLGPTTMGLLDARFLSAPPQPVLNCLDGTVNTDQDALPAVPPFVPAFMSAPQVLDEVKKIQPPGVPVPDTPPLGAFQPQFPRKPVKVSAIPVPGSSCMKCTADWDASADIRVLIATGSFTDEPKRFAAFQQNAISGCPPHPLPLLLEVKKMILPEAVPFIVAGEFEHYLDFVRAFRIAAGRYLGNVRRLTPERTHLLASNQSECESKVELFLMAMAAHPAFVTGAFLTLYTNVFAEDFESLFTASNRDQSGAHDAKFRPPKGQKPMFPDIDLDRNPFGCSAFARKFDRRSFPGIPGAPSDTAVVDTNVPPKKAWHVM